MRIAHSPQNSKSDRFKYYSSSVMVLAAAGMLAIWGVSSSGSRPEVAGRTSPQSVRNGKVLDQPLSVDIRGVRAEATGKSPAQLGVELPLAHERFRNFRRLEEKALKTQEEARSYSELLGDPGVLEESVSILLHPDFTRKPEVIQSERIDRVNYLVKALHSPENPGIQLTIESVERVLLEAKVDPLWPEPMRRAWVGDRVELFMALKHRFPERAQELRARVAGDESASRVFAYADGFYSHQKLAGVRQ